MEGVGITRNIFLEGKSKLATLCLLFLLTFLFFGCTDTEVILVPNGFGTAYGEMYNKSDAGFTTTIIGVVDTYYQVKDLNAGNLKNFSMVDSNLIASQDGNYLVNVSFSFDDGAVGEHGFKVFVGETGMDDCYAHVHASVNTQSGSISCIIPLTTRGYLTFRVDDHANPTNNVTFYSVNVNAVRID